MREEIDTNKTTMTLDTNKTSIWEKRLQTQIKHQYGRRYSRHK